MIIQRAKIKTARVDLRKNQEVNPKIRAKEETKANRDSLRNNLRYLLKTHLSLTMTFLKEDNENQSKIKRSSIREMKVLKSQSRVHLKLNQRIV